MGTTRYSLLRTIHCRKSNLNQHKSDVILMTIKKGDDKICNSISENTQGKLCLPSCFPCGDWQLL